MAEENTSADESALIGEDFDYQSDSTGGLGTYQEYTGNMDQMLSQYKGTSTGGQPAPVKWNPYMTDRVLGQPLYYNDLSDPGGRVYNQTFMQDIPLMFMIPGIPSVNRNLIDVAGKRIVPSFISRGLLELQNNPSSLFNFGARGIGSSDDLRFIGFKPYYKDYFKYVQIMLSTIYSYIGKDSVWDIFNFNEEFNNSLKNYGLAFYLDKSSAISESADNTYGASRTAEMVSEKANTLREAEYLNPMYSNTARVVDSLKAANPLGILEAMGTFDGIITRTANALFRVVNGSQLMFPDMWQDSRFDKSYNLSFKFYSPYGDPLSIFRNVYVPFIALLALALP
jgi:hypothetical protein